MQKSWLRPRWFRAEVLALALTAGSQAAWAQAAAAVVLGQPLNFSVQLRADPSEAVTPECISAEVTAGERRLPTAQIRTALESLGPDGARIRVTTTQRIDDQVVSVQITVGCQARVTRRYMLMAESAAAGAAIAAASAPSSPSAAATPVAAAPARAAPVQRDEARERRPERARPASPSAAKVERTAPTRTAAGGPRLRLDPAEPVLSAESAAVEQAIEVVAQAATAMRAAMAAASAAEQRIKTLERSVAQARDEARSQRELVSKLQAEAAAADDASRWLWPLLLALLGAALLAAVLAWRLWKRPAAQAPALPWRDATESAFDEQAAEPPPSRSATSPTPFVASDLVLPSRAADVAVAEPLAAAAPKSAAASAPRWAVPDTPPPASQQTTPLPMGERGEAPRDVSIEELLDLEQQAEFFVVLGQDSAAIDLLVEHLRLTGGGSPLPYLKLMEIHHRLGEQAAYERTRNRFNERFNAYAPAWAEGLLKGRGLEDYPGVVPRLTQVWGRPLDAMAELEALLFRKSRGDLFDLPAYREVLFLYALARDLFDHESSAGMDVDLLLPIHEQNDTHSTRPAPFDDSGRSFLDGDDEPGGRPTAPVDLDLTTSDRSTSIFDPFDPHAQRARR